MEKKEGMDMVKVDAPGRNFFWFLMLIGVILIAYFSFNIIMNAIYAVDLSGKGVNVVLKEAVVENNTVISEPEIITLHGVTGWVENFSTWLAVNAYILALGTIFFGAGYILTAKKDDKVAVSLFKMRILGGYMLVLSLLMLVLGIDRVYFIPHGAKSSVLVWMDWYVLEFLAHIIWAVVLAALSIFYLRVKRTDDLDGSEMGQLSA
jgi:hypothetical protein